MSTSENMEVQSLNPSIIDGHEWAKDLQNYLNSCTEKYFLNWCKIVIELGVGGIELDNWVEIFKMKIEERYEDLVVDVSEMKAKVLDEITELMAKTCRYAKDLGFEEHLEDINPNERLYWVKKDLKNRTDRLEKLMEERQKEVKQLIEKQKELCDLLEKSPYKLSISPLPERYEIEKVQNYVESMEQEKFNREERYLQLKEAIGKMAEKLQLAPKTDFERDILSETKRNFDIGESNMKQLEECHENMVRQLASMKDEIDHLRKNVGDLWEILEESITKKHLFHEQYDDYTVETLKALRAEAKRCEDLKKANIKVFVEKLRTELRELWGKCFHQNEENHQNYQWLTSDFYTEDLLLFHEMEVSKWKNFYSRNEKLIKLFTEHQSLWDQLMKLENQDSAGANRYKNRGGKLLQEEKERNKLTKKIPFLEERIKEQAFDYEDFTGTPFVIFGTPILEYIDNLHRQRDEERRIKLSARKQAREQETLTPARSCLSIFPSSSKICLTPQASSVKRKLLKPITTGKKPKLESSVKPIQTSALRSIAPDALNRSRRLSHERNKRLKKCRKMLNMKTTNKENLNDTTSTNYDAFERNISTRDGSRSTLKPEEIPNHLRRIPILNVIPCTPLSKSNSQYTQTPKKFTANI